MTQRDKSGDWLGGRKPQAWQSGGRQPQKQAGQPPPGRNFKKGRHRCLRGACTWSKPASYHTPQTPPGGCMPCRAGDGIGRSMNRCHTHGIRCCSPCRHISGTSLPRAPPNRALAGLSFPNVSPHKPPSHPYESLGARPTGSKQDKTSTPQTNRPQRSGPPRPELSVPGGPPRLQAASG